MVLILLFATVVAFVSWWLEGAHGLPADGIVILLIVVANAGLGFSQEYKAEKIIEQLQASTRAKAHVLREGAVREVEQTELVYGDIVELAEGDLVPADLVLIQSSHLKANESLLTGESVTVDKNPGVVGEEAPLMERTSELFAGTVVTAGTARALVVGIGSDTELGKIAESLQSTTSARTPLEERLEKLGKQIGVGVLVLTIVIGLVVLLVEGKTDSATLLRVGMFSVALAVAAVPEGLPAVLTVGLSMGAKRLAARNVLCRQMSAVETLGSVTTIVTDKTGTLTQNQMTIRTLELPEETHQVTGDGYHPEGEVSDLNEQVKELIYCGVMASGGDFRKPASGEVEVVGDPMDVALLVLAEKASMDWAQERRSAEILDEIPFSSERARAMTLRKTPEGSVVYVKGSLEALLKDCTKTAGGRPLGESEKERFRAAEAELGKKALRALAFAKSEPLEGQSELSGDETGLVLLGIAGFEDPPRPDVAEAIGLCRKAGIKVVMCTGDHPITASAVGSKVGLVDEHKPDDVVTGPQVANLNEADFAAKVANCHVCARFAPEQKLQLVDSLLKKGEVLAMTGDGVNDAPALKKVHVGVAMGKSGTAVAVEASDLVITDDNFATIVTAIQEGRGVYLNIQRFITFLFSGNFGVVLAIFAGTLLAGYFDLRTADGLLLLPLSAAQILWMNLVTDGPPALAFALGRSSQEAMEEAPRRPGSPLLGRHHWVLVVSTGTVLAALFLFILDLPYAGGVFSVASWDPVYVQSAAFFGLVTARLANAFNFVELERGFRLERLKGNPYIPGAVLLSWILTLLVVKVEPLAKFFSLQVVEWSHIGILTLVMPPLMLLAGEVVKKILRSSSN